MIRVRTDDVLIHSSAPKMTGREFNKWKKHHLWLQQAPEYFYHTPAILVTEIQEFPDCIQYIREEMEAGRLYPILHGYEHIDYSPLSQRKVEEHLDKSLSWIKDNLRADITIWATPWGGVTDTIKSAAKKFNLDVEGVKDPVVDQSKAVKLVRRTGNLHVIKNKVILVHWFEQGLKLYRIVQVAKYGSWEAAAKAQPEYMGT